MICCALIACNKTEVNFSYSPSAPRAGETVSFSNLSSSGEDWSWTFGDGTTSTLKSPTHVFKQPGTYRVALKVDNNKSLTETKEITVYDTIPTFTASDSVFTIYQDYTFTANVYNPYNYEVEYLWYLPLPETEDYIPYIAITDTTFENSTLHLYFTRAWNEAPLGLRVIMNGDTTDIQKTFNVADRKTNSVLFRTDKGDYRQRIFGALAERRACLIETNALLDVEQDTFQVYNNDTFRLSHMISEYPTLEGFHIAKRKVYFRANGLWVANIDGANIVQIDSAPCSAMTLDTKDSRIYWANEEGVWYMPFVGSDNNKFVTTPTQLNNLKNISKIAADAELK